MQLVNHFAILSSNCLNYQKKSSKCMKLVCKLLRKSSEHTLFFSIKRKKMKNKPIPLKSAGLRSLCHGKDF